MLVWKLVSESGAVMAFPTLSNKKTEGDSDEEAAQDGVRVFIKKKAQLTLEGTEMDYVENKLSSEFVFSNPNIKGTRGYGECFNIWLLRTARPIGPRRATETLGLIEGRNHVTVTCLRCVMHGCFTRKIKWSIWKLKKKKSPPANSVVLFQSCPGSLEILYEF